MGEQCAAGALHAGAFGPPWSPVLRSRVGERHGGLRDAACAALLLSGQPLRIFPRELEPRCPHGLQGGASALQRRPPGGGDPEDFLRPQGPQGPGISGAWPTTKLRPVDLAFGSDSKLFVTAARMASSSPSTPRSLLGPRP